MPTIKTVSGQSLLDVAVTAYGNVDAAALLLADAAFPAVADLADPLPVGIVFPVDDKSPLYKRPALRELNEATVTTLSN